MVALVNENSTRNFQRGKEADVRSISSIIHHGTYQAISDPFLSSELKGEFRNA